ncbi:MAG: hypothetical protein HY650_12025 [Acidobacteria bacterium]|nr:hypothetical protein [Acidobacteriota bacterium]
MLKSTDDGDHWSVLGGNTFAGLKISRIVPTRLRSADGGQIVLAATFAGTSPNNGVYQSQDGGVTWTRVSAAGRTPSDPKEPGGYPVVFLTPALAS